MKFDREFVAAELGSFKMDCKFFGRLLIEFKLFCWLICSFICLIWTSRRICSSILKRCSFWRDCWV